MAQNVIPLTSIARTSKGAMQADLKAGCGAKGKSACGSPAAAGDLPPEVWNKVKDHPCYSEDAHHYFARMHVAVAPACNVQCNYCNRKYDCSNESRPGVVSETLLPEQALRKVMAVAAKVPQLSVIGIAGPGDALANPHKTFHTFQLLKEALPRVKLCLSTNGLALPDHVGAIKALGVDHVTITINAVDPEIGRLIYPWIFHEHRRWTGRDAARILMDRQFKGLDMLAAAGVLVKVNSVMIPGINDEHLKAVNTVVKAHGAFLHNIMPLISDPAHGTHFGVTGQRGPTPDELKALQDGLDGGAKLMKHCRQCRADAVGLLGEDMGADFALDKLEAAEAAYDPRPAEIYREVVEADRADRQNATAMAVARAAAAQPGRTLMLAVATKGGGRVNQHFGHAREFQIYEVDAAGPRFVGHRRADHYCQGGFGEDRALDSVLQALRGIDGIVVARIGDCPRDRMEQAGIPVFQDWAYDYIEPALMACRARMTAKSDNALMESA